LPATPKISVCIPVFNPGSFLEAAIDSVLNQEFEDFELIIVDDCSDQSVQPIVSKYSDERITFHRNSQNLGLVRNWNRCIRAAQGGFISIFHQDDLMLPGNLGHKIAVLDTYPNVGFVYSNIQRIDEDGKIIGGHWLPQPKQDTVFTGDSFFKLVAATSNPVSCPSVIVREECYAQVGLFDAQFPFAADLEMWMRIAKQYNVGYLSKPLLAQRVHPQQETMRFKGTGKDYLDALKVLRLVFSETLPEKYSRHASAAYSTLYMQAIRMSKWKLQQGLLSHGLRYLWVAILSGCNYLLRIGRRYRNS
jgi:glycosyltransferase involved in cell wall biosynthesis